MSTRRPRLPTGLRLAAQGVWFRRSSAVIVLCLATVASAASVVAPLYARAAEDSIVRDTLFDTDAYTRGVHLSRPQSDKAVVLEGWQKSSFAVVKVQTTLTHPAFGRPQLAYQTEGTYHPIRGPQRGSVVLGRVVQRQRSVCPHLDITDGRCPRAAGEAVVTTRSLALLGAHVGDTVPVSLGDLVSEHGDRPPPTLRLTIVGAFEPVPVQSSYWAGQPYFSEFFPEARSTFLGALIPPVADPVFVARGTAGPAGISGYTLDVPVLARRIHLTDTSQVLAQLAHLRRDLRGYDVNSSTQLAAPINRARHGRDLVRIAAPLAVAQLVLLSWWTLLLVVGSATEDRSAELGLAKLRGFSSGQTRRFGLAEIVLLLVVAAPLGVVLGYLAVRWAGPHVFAPGTSVVFTPAVALTVLIALSGGVVTAAIAARRVLRSSVVDLIRRVPPRRRGRRAGVIEGIVIALAIAGAIQLVSDRGERPSPVALLGPGMIAMVGGLLGARLLVGLARNRTLRATQRGKAARLVGWSGVARRPGTARICSVLAVATCLLVVGVEAWAVAERNRVERASGEVGAAVVLSVRATSSSHLLDAVRGADPSGRYAMAAVQLLNTNQEDSVLAVDASRADHVLRWGAPDARPKRSVQDMLAPKLVPSLYVGPGRLTITVDVTSIHSPSPFLLSARLDRDGAPIRVPLGNLALGRHTYRGEVPAACAPHCRLAALTLGHTVSDLGTSTADLSVERLSAGPPGSERPLATLFATAGAWRPGNPTEGGARVDLRPGQQLGVHVATPGGFDAEVVRGDAPDPLPAFAGKLAGPDDSEPGAAPTVVATGISDKPTTFRIVGTGPIVPRAGTTSLLVDLRLALRHDESAPKGDKQVWLSRDDPDAEHALTKKLSRDGVRIDDRDAAATHERDYAGDGAVLALRLLLVCGGAAVLVSLGALLVAAYVGRRQRAYEVAALRAVGLPRRTVTSLLLRENLGMVVVALLTGGAAALVATWFVLPSLPQFDEPSATIPVRYAPDAAAGWATIGGLALLLGLVGLVVSALQLRAGRADRLREGVR